MIKILRLKRRKGIILLRGIAKGEYHWEFKYGWLQLRLDSLAEI